ncbi:MAG: 30S ribosomal protein S16 [Parcubacteria group bacterium CG10_big_fil_rev_8_21_14_0_10_38_31]|nr:MAG: 30S ribosomal protein S16 [Parcubacteria group bacterium CG10_big_fil_rev_8_21_14_0_10_38_31]
MLKIRLKRVGRKHDPSYRVVLTDSRKAASKGEKEILGTYDPRRNNDIKLNADRIKEWMSKGAQASDTVYNLLVNLKIVDGKKRDVRPTIKVAEKELATPEVVKETAPKEEPKAEAVEVIEAKEEAPVVEEVAEEVVEEMTPEVKEEESKSAE